MMKNTFTQTKNFLNSIFQVAKRYKWYLIITFVYLSLSILIMYFELSDISKRTRIDTILRVLTNREAEVVSFEAYPLSFLTASVTPAFYTGVILTAATKFIKEITGAEFGALKSWNSSRNIIKSAKNRIIVLGLGRVGLNLVQMLSETGYLVIGIDVKTKERIELPLENKTFGWLKFARFAAKGTDEDHRQRIPAIWSRDGDIASLNKANIAEASAVCFMADNFDINLFLQMAIKDNYPKLTTIARARDPEQEEIFKIGGIDKTMEPKNDGTDEIMTILKLASSNLIKVYGIINEREYFKLLRKLLDSGFKFIKIWRRQAVNEYCSVKMMLLAPEKKFEDDIFPDCLEIESATISRMKSN